MKDIDQELLSRILDEDLSEFETQRILKEYQSDSELQAVYQRYNIIGHALRHELPSKLNSSFTNEVMAKLSDDDNFDADATDIAPAPVLVANNSNKFTTAIGLAIAASVAVFSFVAIQNFMQPQTGNENIPVVAERVVEESDIQRVSAEELQSIYSNPNAAAEFNSYIVNHAEYASPRVSMPHVRIVGYDQVIEENSE